MTQPDRIGTLVAYREEAFGPGPPYAIVRKALYMFRTPTRFHGKRYFQTFDGASRTWLTDQEARNWLRRKGVHRMDKASPTRITRS